ncbi:glycoside hydrolase family 79 protein [Peniophora sp. CONT]|nr:glycoside hydrolase family 79 protein [Peniophora sp. CONT]
MSPVTWTRVIWACFLASSVFGITVPSSAPSTAKAVDPALLSISLEFFAFPAYTSVTSTSVCMNHITSLRGHPPAVRIGGTTQDRATYVASQSDAVDYTVASSGDAPTTLTYGPSFFTLASQLADKPDVTIGLNRQLNNQANSLQAAQKAKSAISNLYAVEVGNEPDLYSTSSPIATTGAWNPTLDGQSQASWQNAMAGSIGNIFQAGVYISGGSWSIPSLISNLGSAISHTKTISRHAYPQSACNGASTNLQTLMSHSNIASYAKGYASEATAAHAQGKKYFLGETNSATCGGGGISPTFGAALWIIDYVLGAAYNGVDRLYFHQGTIGNCQYCFWGRFTTGAPFYGVWFVSQFIGVDGSTIAMLDDGTGAVATYAVFNSAGKPLRALIYNSAYFDGTGTRSSASISLTGLSSGSKSGLRLTAPASTSRVDEGAAITIGGALTFDGNCGAVGSPSNETITASNGQATVTVKASEAFILYL